MAFIQSDLLPMYSKLRPILPTPPIFHKQAPQLALISGASRGRLQKISWQSFAIFNLFRTEREQAGEPRSTWFHRTALIIAGLVSIVTAGWYRTFFFPCHRPVFILATATPACYEK